MEEEREWDLNIDRQIEKEREWGLYIYIIYIYTDRRRERMGLL